MSTEDRKDLFVLMLKIILKWVKYKKLQKLNITRKMMRYMQMNLKDQVDLLDKATNKAIKQVIKNAKVKSVTLY
jgi:2-phospho-L-lactate guanylyltransferase (CobY/MobA/RfbA family)